MIVARTAWYAIGDILAACIKNKTEGGLYMAANVISVSEAEANRAMANITKKADDVKKVTDQLQKEVQSTSSWWKGKSQEAFVEAIRDFSAKFNTEVAKCLDDNAKLLQATIRAHQEADEQIAAQINRR